MRVGGVERDANLAKSEDKHQSPGSIGFGKQSSLGSHHAALGQNHEDRHAQTQHMPEGRFALLE